jgi:hypothetical protein
MIRLEGKRSATNLLPVRVFCGSGCAVLVPILGLLPGHHFSLLWQW